MADTTETWICPVCGAQVDISTLGLYAEVQCPQCMHQARVHDMLGNYRLEGVLGIGGMSVVYRALDVELNRPLALKVLNESFRDQADRAERFENECAMMARVRHENVTAVYSAGHAFGQFYIAMEMVEGKNLEHMVTPKRPMQAMQALGIISQVAVGLDAAAKAGLLHRDMKPGNILITSGGQAKVIDFGLAMDSHEDDTEEIIWATPYYVPPETLERAPEDSRTDIYALGMTLRYLLTGVEKFSAPADSISALLECKRNLPPFSQERPHLPASLCRLVDHMTKFAAADRPKNYTELLEELEDVQQELLEAEQLLLMPGNGRRRKPTQFITPAVLLSLLLGGLYAYHKLPPKPEREQDTLPLETLALPQAEASPLEEALELLRKKEYAPAVRSLLRVAAATDDPTVGALAARLAQVVLIARGGDAASAQQARSLLQLHLSNAEHVLPSGRRIFDALSRTQAEENAPRKPWQPLRHSELSQAAGELERSKAPAAVLATRWFMLAELAYYAGEVQLATRCLSQVRSLPLQDELSVLSDLLSVPATSVARKAFPVANASTRAATLMSRHRLKEAQEELATIAQAGSAASPKAQVLQEVCTVGAAVLEALQRKLPTDYKPGMNSIQLASLAGKAGSSQLPDLRQEVRLLGLLLEGEHESAFAEIETLGAENKLRTPFSVFALDWAKRWLGSASTQFSGNMRLIGNQPPLQENATPEQRREYLADLVARCNRCAMVRGLPDKQVHFTGSFSPLGPGQMMFCTEEVAQALIRRELVEKLDIEIVAVAGLSPERYNTYSLRPGEIQPCRIGDAEHFEETGAGKIIRSMDDLEAVIDKLNTNPTPYMLQREVQL